MAHRAVLAIVPARSRIDVVVRLISGRAGSRDREEESAAPTQRALCPDAPAVTFDDALGDGKSESGASTIAPRRLPKSVKNMRQVIGRDPGAAVCHREYNLLIV